MPSNANAQEIPESPEAKIARLNEEREFHDRIRLATHDQGVSATRYSPELESTISSNALWRNMKYYSVERRSRNFVTNLFDIHGPQNDVLDLCCGNGEDSLYLASHGANRVIGLDISPVSIENCKRQSDQHNSRCKPEFIVGDAENTGLPDHSFDLISEYGALHHVDCRAVYAEMARLLKPNGIVVCTEAIAHNPVIHAYRKLTPSLRTANEVDRILTKRDILAAKQWFNKVEIHWFHLATIAAVPFRRTFLFKPALFMTEAIDSVLLSIPGFRWMAWQAVFTLSEPRAR